MKIHEIVFESSYLVDLSNTIKDIIVKHITDKDDSVSTEELDRELTIAGYNLSIDQIISAVDHTGYANSVNRDKIVFNNSLGLSSSNITDAGLDLSTITDREAMRSIRNR